MAMILLIIRPPLSLAVPETAYPALRVISLRLVDNQAPTGHPQRPKFLPIQDWRATRVIAREGSATMGLVVRI